MLSYRGDNRTSPFLEFRYDDRQDELCGEKIARFLNGLSFMQRMLVSIDTGQCFCRIEIKKVRAKTHL